MRSDDMVTLKQAAAAGLGVVALPVYTCTEDVAVGRLSRLLPYWIAGLPEISLLMYGRRGNPSQVDALAAFLRRELPDVMSCVGWVVAIIPSTDCRFGPALPSFKSPFPKTDFDCGTELRDKGLSRGIRCIRHERSRSPKWHCSGFFEG